MGFFSWKCKGCGHPMINPHTTNKINVWMSNVVIILRDIILKGEYDGYGRVIPRDGFPEDIDDAGDDWYEYENNLSDHAPDCWHRSCWELAGRPKKYAGESPNADDQGFFFDEEHNMPDPIKILRTQKKNLPTLIGIHPDWDKIIEKRLKE